MNSLNEAQQRAVTADDGPALVLAGAGSGKTRVIVERIIWLVEQRGLDPRNLLAVTFTNRAANEMKTRVAERLGPDRPTSWIGTFHGFGLYLLRREIDKLGRPKNFTIFDDGDQLSLMKRLVRNLEPAYEKVSPREALEWISRLKQEVKTPDPDEVCFDAAEETYRVLWTRYHDALSRARALDFDDLLVYLVRVLGEHPEVRQKYQRRFRHVLVDEYQDTNRAQYLIAKRLTEEERNLFVVGDEDQSIYSWRGADIRNILEFEKDFPGARVFRLEENYRSTAPILAAANAVVKNNEERLGKNLWTGQTGGDPVRFYQANDGEDEARFVVEEILASGLSPKEMAVLYRTNAQARVMEEALLRKGVPYVVVGATRFYSRKEIKDILCYLRLLVNPADDESFRRVINLPPRGIGGVTLARFEEYAAARGLPLLDVLREVEQDHTIGARARSSAEEFLRLIDDLALEARTASVTATVESLLEKTTYRAFLRQSDEKDFRTRLEVVDEFLIACAEFDKKKAGGLLEFLQELSLVSEIDAWDSQTPAVTLMTAHSAKGLEFDWVFLVGLEEGLLPHASAEHSDGGIEEERRLCYVAMTRAGKRLTLSAARVRRVYGETSDRVASRFLNEIAVDTLQRVNREPSGHTGIPKPRAEAVEGPLKFGTRVYHPKFGEGHVMSASGSGKRLKARIRFQTGRVATIMVNQSPLEIQAGRSGSRRSGGS